MKIISFAWTTPALLAGRKTVTRREWNPFYAKDFREGDMIQAYDKTPRWGGKKVAVIRLTCKPSLERLSEAPESDYEAEGLAWMEEQSHRIQGQSPREFWRAWKEENPLVWVVRFELCQLD